MKHVYNITCSQVLVKTAVHFEEKPFFLATLTSCKAHFKFKFRYGIYIWYFGYYSSSEVSSELLESSKLIINSSVATLGLVLDGLAANAAESITGDHAASPFTRRCCGIFGRRGFGSFDSTESMFLSPLTWSRRTLRGDSVFSASCCSRRFFSIGCILASAIKPGIWLRNSSTLMWSFEIVVRLGRRDIMTSLHLRRKYIRKKGTHHP